MSEQDPKQPTPPPEKTFQIMLVQTVVFAAVFFTIIWLVEGHSAIAAAIGIGFVVYMFAKNRVR